MIRQPLMGTHEIAFTKGAVSENQFVYGIQFPDGKVNLLGWFCNVTFTIFRRQISKVTYSFLTS